MNITDKKIDTVFVGLGCVNTKQVRVSSSETIFKHINVLLTDESIYNKMSQAHNPYDDGRACEKMIKSL